MTPNLAIVRIETPGWHGFPLWIPLFLLWIPAIVFAPLILLIVIGVSLAGRINPGRALGVLWSVVCSLPGTNVRVCADGKRIQVQIL